MLPRWRSSVDLTACWPRPISSQNIVLEFDPSSTSGHVQSNLNQVSRGAICLFEYLVQLDFRPSIEKDEQAHCLACTSILDESPTRPGYEVKCIDRIWLNQYYPMLFPKRQLAPFVPDKLYRETSRLGICCIYVGRLILYNDQIHLLWL